MAIRNFGGGAGGAGFGVVAAVKLDGTEDNLICGWNFDSNATDLGPSNFVLDQDTPVYETTIKNYSGEFDVADVSTTQLLGTTEGAASGAAFQVPVATDLSFGGMFKIETGTESTPYFISNSTAATNINYAIVAVGEVIQFQTSAALVSTGWSYDGFVWVHLAMVSTSSRTSTQFYLNGRAYGSPMVTTATTPHADSELYIGNVVATNGDLVGKVANVFVADTAYTAGEILTLAENSFGHALPTLAATADPA